MKNLTRKEFDELRKQYEPIYIADEYKGKKHWTVWTFVEVEGEYHQPEIKTNGAE